MSLHFEGRVWQDDKFWIIEASALFVITQGHSRRDALSMLEDAVESLVNRKGFKVHASLISRDTVLLSAQDGASERLLTAFFLRRQRTRYGLTLEEMARRLHVKSRNSYAQYEQGRSVPSLSQIQTFLSAMNREAILVLNVVDRKAA
jgi:DNA-binding transcriptional regulator YiaG